MTETLTKSFCERCGTRYTFESARPRVRLKGVKVLSRGIKNFVLSDDSTMDEAMAAARNETDRELTTHQLDAFHATFNFCMSCRQYTCPNCWNEAEARCLSCAPHLGHEVLPAPFPDLPATAVMIGDPVVASGNGSNGAAHDEAAPEGDDFDFAARLATISGVAAVSDVASPTEVSAETEPVAEAAGVSAAEADIATDEVEPGPESAAPVAAVLETEERASTPAWLAALAAGAAVEGAKADEPVADQSIADKTAAQTSGLLGRFRPDESLDAEPDVTVEEAAAETDAAPGAEAERLDAEQAERLAAEQADAQRLAAAKAAVALEAATQAEADRLAAEQAEAARLAAEQAEAERLAAEGAEAERIAAEQAAAQAEADRLAAEQAEAARLAAEQAEAERVAAEIEAAATAEAAAAAARDDVVKQPTWQMVAPDPGNEAPLGRPGDPASVTPPAAATADPNAEPQWPARPAGIASGLPFLNRPAHAAGRTRCPLGRVEQGSRFHAR